MDRLTYLLTDGSQVCQLRGFDDFRFVLYSDSLQRNGRTCTLAFDSKLVQYCYPVCSRAQKKELTNGILDGNHVFKFAITINVCKMCGARIMVDSSKCINVAALDQTKLP